MSRDYTPEECYLTEQHIVKTGGSTRIEFLEGLQYLNPKTNAYEPAFSKEEISARKEFPLIGSLMARNFMYLYKKLSKMAKLQVLHNAEEELHAYITIGKGDCDSNVIRWFKGAYSEDEVRNSAGFIMYLLKSIKEVQ